MVKNIVNSQQGGSWGLIHSTSTSAGDINSPVMDSHQGPFTHLAINDLGYEKLMLLKAH
jgi:hypothetical protein